MINKVLSVVKKYSMIDEGSSVVAAVSGGSDSMAMLHILDKLKDIIGFSLQAIHVNHGIRGAEADSDERFVEEYCKENNIPLRICRADVIGFAEQNGIGLEEAGRIVRYSFFEEYGHGVLVATAHNATDRAETFLFNFTRGSVLRGLGSIPPIRDNFIRPLIECSKAEIEEYCSLNNVGYVIDKSNVDVVYARNRIRHNVLTELRVINPSLETTASRCIDSLREDELYLSDCARKLVLQSQSDESFSASVIADAPLPIKKRAIIRIIENHFGITPDGKAVDEILHILSYGGIRQINGGINVRVRSGILEFPQENEGGFNCVPLKEGRYTVGNATVDVSFVTDETDCSQKISNNISIFYLDYDKIIGKAQFRSRAAGDKITLPKRCTKSLKKLFNELSLLPEKRDSLIILADESGVMCIEGIGTDSRFALTNNTNRIIRIEITK
jgi:tRNA(Ile)-lysidine synthase